MLPYIVTFTLSTVLLLFAEKSQYSIVRRVFIILGILLPTLLAGFRADTVGTDVKVYLNQIYTGALNSKNFNEYLSYNWFWIYRYRFVNDYEIGFTSVIYLVTKIFGSKSMVLITNLQLTLLYQFAANYALKTLQEILPNLITQLHRTNVKNDER